MKDHRGKGEIFLFIFSFHGHKKSLFRVLRDVEMTLLHCFFILPASISYGNPFMYILLYLTESRNKIALETKRPPTYHIVLTNLISSYWVLKDILFLKVSKDFYDDLLIIFLKRSD